jgi:hypothetical protein
VLEQAMMVFSPRMSARRSNESAAIEDASFLPKISSSGLSAHA